MTRHLLNTSIIGNVVNPAPSALVLAWMGARRDEELHVAARTVAEICRGILKAPPGRRLRALEDWASGPQGLEALVAGGVLFFDARAALAWAELMAEGAAAGPPRSALDMGVAALASVHGCRSVTNTEGYFAGFDVINPMRDGAASKGV